MLMDRPRASRRLTILVRVVAAALLFYVLPVLPASAAHPNALWHVVHDLCVRDRKITGLPAPCIRVNLHEGYAVVPDLRTAAQLLVVPTRRITGIEDPQLLEPGGPNYWQFAWDTRGLLAERLGDDLARDDVAMAVNAIPGRSQEQLHIHVSCIRADVADELKSAASNVGESWAPITLNGETWRAREVLGEDFGETDPFKLLASSDAATAATMGRQTLVVVGAQLNDRTPGFYLLTRAADPATGYSGHGEFLLDKHCRVLRAKSISP